MISSKDSMKETPPRRMLTDSFQINWRKIQEIYKKYIGVMKTMQLLHLDCLNVDLMD